MATWDDVRAIALGLPHTAEGTSFGNVAWKVGERTFAWERPLRKSDLAALGPSAPRGPILGVRTEGLEAKQVLLDGSPELFFTTPHFDGFSAVLVRLSKIGKRALRDVLVDAWFARAPARIANAFAATRAPARRRRG